MKRPEDAKKILFNTLRDEGKDFFDVFNDGYGDVVAWKHVEFQTFGLSTVKYGEDKVCLTTIISGLTYLQLCAESTKRVSDKAKENITQTYRRIKSA